MDKCTSVLDKIAERFLEWPEMVTDNGFSSSVDCITKKLIPVGTRIVTTSAKTKKRFGLNNYNLTMTIDTYNSMFPNHKSTTRNGQRLWEVDPRSKEAIIDRIHIVGRRQNYNSDLSDVEQLYNSIK